ncbi:MAG: aspartate-semialdehyde dehydrogenase [Armatimonadota bacterium]
MAGYNVAVVGAGAVGEEMLKVLRQRNFPISNLKVMARSARRQVLDEREFDVIPTTEDAFDGIDIAFFAGTEGEKGASQLYGWEAVKRGAVVVDNGDDFRMDPRVPLVVPEVNPEALDSHQGIIANPNCSTIQMVAALAPLHKKAVMKRIVVSTYQSVSGSGGAAIRELQQQVKACASGCDAEVKEYPYQIHGNLIPQISKLKDEFPGYYGEEIKMIKETRKIFGCSDLAVSATCVRVPVIRAHSETVNVQFEHPITADEARAILSSSPGIEVIDDPENGKYPMPLLADGTDPVYVGRIRQDSSCPNTLDMWVVADNIRKGAALNAVQIAECMIERGLINRK